MRDYSSADVIELISDVKPERKLYLLCVLRKIGPQDYAKSKALAGLTKETEVSTFSGNVLTSESAFEVLRQIETSNCSALSWTAVERVEK